MRAGIWGKAIENLAVLNYDHDDLSLASYDWRLSCVLLPLLRALHVAARADSPPPPRRFYNLEVRDHYFSRLKIAIEFNLNVNERKTVLVSHSMGSSLLLVRPCAPSLDRALGPC